MFVFDVSLSILAPATICFSEWNIVTICSHCVRRRRATKEAEVLNRCEITQGMFHGVLKRQGTDHCWEGSIWHA